MNHISDYVAGLIVVLNWLFAFKTHRFTKNSIRSELFKNRQLLSTLLQDIVDAAKQDSNPPMLNTTSFVPSNSQAFPTTVLPPNPAQFGSSSTTVYSKEQL